MCFLPQQSCCKRRCRLREKKKGAYHIWRWSLFVLPWLRSAARISLDSSRRLQARRKELWFRELSSQAAIHLTWRRRAALFNELCSFSAACTPAPLHGTTFFFSFFSLSERGLPFFLFWVKLWQVRRFYCIDASDVGYYYYVVLFNDIKSSSLYQSSP